MSTYAQQKIHLRTVLDCGGRLVGRPPWPSLRTSPGWGAIAPMLLAC